MQTLGVLDHVRGVRLENEADGRCELTVEVDPAAENMDETLSYALSDAKMPVLRMERHEASLEEVFIKLTADSEPMQTEGGEQSE